MLSKFDSQINALLNNGKRSEASYVNTCKRCFELAFNFTLNDWREVRKGDYFEVMDNIKGTHNKALFRLERIKKYLDSK